MIFGTDQTDPVHPGRGVAPPGLARIHELTWVAQDRGHLLAGQVPDQIPFVPQRFFVVMDVPPGESRGQHAHRQCHQLLVALKGSLAAKVWDTDGHRTYSLDTPSMGLHMPPMTYGTQVDYSSDAVLLVLASDPYDVEDYLDSFEEFCRVTGNRY